MRPCAIGWNKPSCQGPLQLSLDVILAPRRFTAPRSLFQPTDRECQWRHEHFGRDDRSRQHSVVTKISARRTALRGPEQTRNDASRLHACCPLQTGNDPTQELHVCSMGTICPVYCSYYPDTWRHHQPVTQVTRRTMSLAKDRLNIYDCKNTQALF